MKIRFCFTLGLLLVAATAMGQDQPKTPDPFLRMLGNSVWWTSLNAEAKNNFVDGYTTAMGRANYMAAGLCKDSINSLKPGNQFNAQLDGADRICILAQFFNYEVDVKKLTDGLDEFYNDAQNRLIPVQFAIEYERDKLKGDTSPNDLQKKLEGWREILNKRKSPATP